MSYNKNLSIWKITLGTLFFANIAFLIEKPAVSFISIIIFLTIPGLLLLNLLENLKNKSAWWVLSLSVGLSLVLIMIGGLLLNSLHALGVDRPLEKLNILGLVNLYTASLILLNRHKKYIFDINPKIKFTANTFLVALLTALPLLAIGGAIRLNNGATNILTLIMFATMAILFVILIIRKDSKHLYPYAVYTFALAILLSTSLRGWGITGHDIQHEVSVLKIAYEKAFWDVTYSDGPYNACLSITILPLIISKISSISLLFVYKIVFQFIFSFGVVATYIFIKKISNAQLALISSFLFISFPTFLNDMPFLNRQEIAFLFFSLTLLVNVSTLKYRIRYILTLVFMLGLLLSHYSSNYVALSIFIAAFIIFYVLKWNKKNIHFYTELPLLKPSLLVICIFMTILWGIQVTSTSPTIEPIIRKGMTAIKNGSYERSGGVSYGLFQQKVKSNEQLLSEFAGNSSDDNIAVYSPENNMPSTQIGEQVSKIVDVNDFHKTIRQGTAKLLQVFLIIGLFLMLKKHYLDKSPFNRYHAALVMACFIALVLVSIVPSLSVMYGVTRLFQQTLIITALPIVLASKLLLGNNRKYAIPATAVLYSFIFLHLSGFIPQLLGNYPPQLSLNNKGTYYNIYYQHKSEIISSQWLYEIDSKSTIAADSYAASRLPGYPKVGRNICSPIFNSCGTKYSYDDYANTKEGLYASFLSGNVIEYFVQQQDQYRYLIYSNSESNIYEIK